MFIHRSKGQFDTIRAGELQIGDRFVFDGNHIKVVSATNYKGEMTVLMERITMMIFWTIKSATFPNEMFITIARR